MSYYQHKDMIVKDIETCTEKNYLRFNNKFYIQTKRLPIRSALSPVIAEIYMDG